MKKIFSLLVFGVALALSCEKSGPETVNRITDLYTAPEGASVMNLSGAESTWSTDRRYFDLSFGSSLTTTLVGYDALLTPGQYVIGGDQIGNAINTKVNGQTPQNGFITVHENNGTYQITGTFGDEVLFWTGTLPFVADPAPLTLTEVLSAQSNKGNGVNTVTMNLATAGIHQEFDMTTYQNVWVGEGKYIAIDLYSDDGYLHDGAYKASAVGGTVESGEFGIGYDTEVDWGWGPMLMENWGTCLWTVSGGTATGEKITEGLVNVTSREEKVDDKDVTIWTISWGAEYPVEVLFEGAIPALTKPKKPSGPVVPDYLYTDEVTPGDGIDTHAITITDKDGNAVAYLELLTANGETDLSGSYPATSYASQPGQMRDGYNFPDWGISGGSWYMNGSEKVYIGAGAATVDVTKIAEGAYSFTCALFSFDAAGPDYVPGEGVETDHLYTIGEPVDCSTSAGEVVSGVKKYPFTITDSSGQEAAYLEFVLVEGSTDIAEGDYVSTEYAHEAGQLANGYFFDMGDWGSFSGGSYYIKDGAKVFIDPGLTVTVTQLGPGAFKFSGDGFEIAAAKAN